MARDKADNTGTRPVATTAAAELRAENAPVWEKVKVAEDELSEAWELRAKLDNLEQLIAVTSEPQVDTFWPSIADLARRCDEVLQQNGFPPAGQMVQHDGAGNWWSGELPSTLPVGLKLMMVANFAQEFADGFSDAWYAGRIFNMCNSALDCLRQGNAGSPHNLSLIFEIASLRTDWRWRRGNKTSIITGRGVRKGGQVGGEMRRRKYAPDTESRIAEMRRLISGGLSKSGAAEALHRRGIGASAAANLKLWQRHNDKS